MRPYDIIRKKRDGQALTESEISQLITDFAREEVKDFQMAAWAMAVYFRGMNDEEVAWLTNAIVASGVEIDLSGIEGVKVDKHSTGGVGDTTTLILAPLVASAGVPVAKMSGRGLGHTGGTIDKLESFPGFQVQMSVEQFISNVNRHKIAVIGQTDEIAPADGMLYALRDLTATVDSIPLIASSIMSKKIAAGADALVLDVKMGNGAFMQTGEKAFELARTMVRIGENLGRRTVAFVTAMDRPLGDAVGNALEVREAIAVLEGKSRGDLRELSLELGASMLVLAGAAADLTAARNRLAVLIDSGAALVKFQELVEAQGGDAAGFLAPELLPRAPVILELRADAAGWIQSVKTREIGAVAMELGAGRKLKGEQVDLAVGLEILVKPGIEVQVGQVLARVHARTDAAATAALPKLADCFIIGDQAIASLPLICGRIDAESEISYI